MNETDFLHHVTFLEPTLTYRDACIKHAWGPLNYMSFEKTNFKAKIITLVAGLTHLDPPGGLICVYLPTRR